MHDRHHAGLRWKAHPRGANLLAPHGEAAPVARLASFTQGFYRLATAADGQLRITDLRMGLEPTTPSTSTWARSVPPCPGCGRA